QFGGQATLLRGVGDGTFLAGTSITIDAASGNSAVAAGDLIGNGILDLVVEVSGGFDVVLGNGDGTFKAPVRRATSFAQNGVAVADLTGDGKLDLIVTESDSAGDNGQVQVFAGNGDGTFGTPSTYTSGLEPRGIAVADLNG